MFIAFLIKRRMYSVRSDMSSYLRLLTEPIGFISLVGYKHLAPTERNHCQHNMHRVNTDTGSHFDQAKAEAFAGTLLTALDHDASPGP